MNSKEGRERLDNACAFLEFNSATTSAIAANSLGSAGAVDPADHAGETAIILFNPTLVTAPVDASKFDRLFDCKNSIEMPLRERALVLALCASLPFGLLGAPVMEEPAVHEIDSGLWGVRVVLPHRESMATLAHPPKRVQDLHGKHVELPYAQSREDAVACVKAWRALPTTMTELVGNRQHPFSSWSEDVHALDKLLLKDQGDEGIPALWSDGLSESTSFLFMEMGAFDGVSEANTALYERCLNWTGILMEANPIMFPKLVLSRRTGSFLVHASATCPRSEANQFGNMTESVQIEAHSYTSASIFDQTNEGKVEGATPNPKHFNSVPCTDLTSILTRTIGSRAGYLKKTPDLFFLDVEGSEYNVLRTLNMETHKIPIIIAEAQNRNCGAVCPKRDAVRVLMTEAGYETKPVNSLISHSDVFIRT